MINNEIDEENKTDISLSSKLCNDDSILYNKQIWSKFKCLKKLDLNSNLLSTLPDELEALAPTLDILFLSENNFEDIPSVIGKLENLRMLSLRGNRLNELSSRNLPSSLVWLILTNNHISRIDANVQKIRCLRKLMLSHNQLTRIPIELASCEQLELVRLANNKIHTPLPKEVLTLPKLAWISLAGNPLMQCPQTNKKEILRTAVSFDDSSVLGKGASGTVYKGKFGAENVAIKIFKQQSMGSDGNPEDEASINALVDHPLAVSADGIFRSKGDGAHEGMVMELLEGAKPLGKVPSFATVTRDEGPTADAKGLHRNQVLSVIWNVATALDHVHTDIGVSNGDIYLHNVLKCSKNIARVSDWGASFKYDKHNDELSSCFEKIEVLAFGRLVQDLFDWHLNTAVPDSTEPSDFLGRSRGVPMEQGHLHDLIQSILQPNQKSRPSFKAIIKTMSSLPDFDEARKAVSRLKK